MLLGALAATTAGGCLSLGEESVVFSPTVNGQVQDAGGAPLEGIRVGVVTESEGWHCRRFAVATATDAAGRFELPATRGDLPFFRLGHQGNSYQVCMGNADSLSVVDYAIVGYQEPPPIVTLTCIIRWKAGDAEEIECDDEVEYPTR